jgi:hypothetical protein
VTAVASPLQEAPRQHRLGAYAIWQLRDYLIEKGIATVIVMALFGYLTIWPPLMMARRSGQGIDQFGPVLDQVLVMLLGQLVFIGALFAVNGIVAEDRKQGFFRFYFAKPVSVPLFYAQKLAMHTAGFAVAAVLLIGAYWYLVQPLAQPLLLPVLVMLFLGIAGIGFLISAIWKHDLMSLIAFYLGANVLWEFFQNDQGWRGQAVYVLPPLHRMDDVLAPVLTGGTLPTSLLLWIAGYGVGCAVLGLIVIRRRALSSS